MRKNVYMNPPLERLAEKAESRGFSAALGQIVERYEMLVEMTELPDFTDIEIAILSECICGSVIDRRKIRGLHLDIFDCVLGTKEEKEALTNKIESMSVADRLALVGRLGQ